MERLFLCYNIKMNKNIYIASDHAGFDTKEVLKQYLKDDGYTVFDLGPEKFDPTDDYPLTVSPVAIAMEKDPGSRGIVLGASGQGEAIVLNKFKHIRCGLYYGGNEQIVVLAREHNDTNVLSLGALFLTAHEATQAVSLWLSTPFSENERHQRRVTEIEKLQS